MRALVSTLLGSLKIATGFLPSWVGLLPYVFAALGGITLIGYVYIEGARSERAAQAVQTAKLNAKIAELNAKQAAEDATEDVRVANALAKARAIFAADPTGQTCRKLDAASAAKIKAILGGQ
jgi:hypothetical protein